MKKIGINHMEDFNGGGLSGACGFLAGVATVAALTTAPVAPVTWGLIGAGFTMACGGALLESLHM